MKALLFLLIIFSEVSYSALINTVNNGAEVKKVSKAKKQSSDNGTLKKLAEQNVDTFKTSQGKIKRR
jgi:NAD-dependent SIR2 family protein deacetylase